MAVNSSPASASSSRTGRALEVRRPATRSLSRITEDDSNDDGEERVAEARQRDSSQRRRTSFASQRTTRRSKSRTAMSMTERGEDPNTPRVKRTKIRPSLAGPQVHEMDIETRAQVLIPIAEDCIVQLLRAGLNGSIYRKGITQTWRLAWDSLQTQRRNKLFSPDSLPFNDFEDVREAFHSSVRIRINTASLERAIHLSNLATFLWIILQPDEAHTLLESTDGNNTVPARLRRRRSVAGEETQDIKDIVSRRNRVFRMAWKRYWKDVIPQSMRGNKRSIQLWALLSVQIMMMFRSPGVDAQQDIADSDLPLPDPEVSAELFSASAIVQYGQWTIDSLSAHSLNSKETAQRRWTDIARTHRTELREVREEVLTERFPYDEFRLQMLGFIDEAVLHTLISHSVSPRKPDLDDLISAAGTSDLDGADPPRADSDVEDENPRDPLVGLGMETEMIEPEPAVNDEQRQADKAMDLDFELDLDILDQVLNEMTPGELGPKDEDERRTSDDFPSDLDSDVKQDGPDRQLDRQVRLSQQGELPIQEQEEIESDHVDIPSDLDSGDIPSAKDLDSEEDETEWAIKEDSKIAARPKERAFQFATGNVQAEQVLWESQSQSGTPKRSARTPLFLPGHASDSDTARSASATPRPRKRVSRLISNAHEVIAQDGVLADNVGKIGEEDESLMPGSSVLGTPTQSGKVQNGGPGLMPSPLRRDIPSVSRDPSIQVDNDPGSQLLNHAPSGGEGSEPSESPSPQRLQVDGHSRNDVNLTQATNGQVASSSRREVTVNAHAPARSQRFLVDPRKRRRPKTDFASVSSDDKSDDNDIVPTEDLPPLRVANTQPSSSVQQPRTPLRNLSQNQPTSPVRIPSLQQSPRTPNVIRKDPRPSSVMRDFIIVPWSSHRSEVSATANAVRPRSESPVVDVGNEARSDSPAAVSESRSVLASTVFNDEDRPRLERFVMEHADRPRSTTTTEEYDEAPVIRHHSRSVPRASAPIVDPFLCDADSSPLEPNPDYVTPRGHVSLPSFLHGQVAGQASIYSRKAGKRRWTNEEQLLLYRTVQKIPLEEPYPLRVVWNLHGEHGELSTELQDYNPQHMKDKMKTIVQTRFNNDRVIEGRARFWLPAVENEDGTDTMTHPDKLALQAELDAAKKERDAREWEEGRAAREDAVREALRAAAEREAEKKRGKDKGKGRGKGKAKAKGKGKGKARQTTTSEEEKDELADEHDSDEDHQAVVDILESEPNPENDEDIESNASEPPTRPRRQDATSQQANRVMRPRPPARRVVSSATEGHIGTGNSMDEASKPPSSTARAGPGGLRRGDKATEAEAETEIMADAETTVRASSYDLSERPRPTAKGGPGGYRKAHHPAGLHAGKGASKVVGEKPKRHRLLPYVEIPASRSSFVTRSRIQSAPTQSRHQREASRSDSGEGPIDELSESDLRDGNAADDPPSEAETDYAAPTNGRMMKRSKRPSEPEQAETQTYTESDSQTDDELESEDGTIRADQEFAASVEEGEDAGMDAYDRRELIVPEGMQLSPEREEVSEEDEDEANERLARMHELRQKVLGGEDP